MKDRADRVRARQEAARESAERRPPRWPEAGAADSAALTRAVSGPLGGCRRGEPGSGAWCSARRTLPPCRRCPRAPAASWPPAPRAGPLNLGGALRNCPRRGFCFLFPVRCGSISALLFPVFTLAQADKEPLVWGLAISVAEVKCRFIGPRLQPCSNRWRW